MSPRRVSLALSAVLALCSFGGLALAQTGELCADGADSCGPNTSPLCPARACSVQPVQDISLAYRYGQAVLVECDDGYPPCPPASDVDIKVTVLRSVAKVLHSGTTISGGATDGPRLGKDIHPDPDDSFDNRSHFYFVKLKPAVVRRMKAIKVRDMSATVSGTVTRPDGTKANIPSKLVTTGFNGNCSGRDLHFQRRLTYGGHCVPH